MSATILPPPPTNRPLQDGSGGITALWAAWFARVYNRLGGAGDKVDAAWQAAMAAAPAARNVVGAGGLQSGGPLTADVGLTLYRTMAEVALLPTTGLSAGDWAYAFDGRNPGQAAGAGTGVPCFWNKTHWIAVTTGAAVTA